MTPRHAEGGAPAHRSLSSNKASVLACVGRAGGWVHAKCLTYCRGPNAATVRGLVRAGRLHARPAEGYPYFAVRLPPRERAGQVTPGTETPDEARPSRPRRPWQVSAPRAAAVCRAGAGSGH